MSTRTKRDIVEHVAQATRQPRTVVRKTIQTFLDRLIHEISHENRLEFRDFGVFEVRQRSPRVVQNPRTQERVIVPAGKAVRFKAGRKMRQALDELVVTSSNGNGHGNGRSNANGKSNGTSHNAPPRKESLSTAGAN